ncbi:hypothetical protein FRB94_013739 [Tulasnella sp. JGI-2019a]|nr:hypothetical protein FRB94_013739 [Tulasnella sp. JGI-2019a]KAG9009182.1 hypothetical protein FRB93_005678 [Tulasnella sp. JGI-2019a]KAG9038186.1 hypothetical protein FRB95_002626 [Tulasnella sp. JGI-2019a]
MGPDKRSGLIRSNDFSSTASEPNEVNHTSGKVTTHISQTKLSNKTSSRPLRFQPYPRASSESGCSAQEIEGTIVQERKYHLGAYADVWRGKWIVRGRPDVSVAIKYLRCVKMSTQSSRTPEAQAARIDKRLRREVYAWEKLTHPNITPLLGYRSGEEPLLISPYYENGNLGQYLIAHPDAPRLKLIVGAANGLLYLHTLNPVVVHGDIKPDNVLVNDVREAALCDFGLARVIEGLRTGLTTSGQGQGGKGYIAPELLDYDEGEGKTKESDVFAFGGLILHTMSGFPPFYDKSVSQALTEVCFGRFPPKDRHPLINSKATLWNLMQKCWAKDPAKRPDIREIYEVLTEEEMIYAKTGSLRQVS